MGVRKHSGEHGKRFDRRYGVNETIPPGDVLTEYGSLCIEMRRIHGCHGNSCALQCSSKVVPRINAIFVTHSSENNQELGLDLERSIDMVEQGQQKIDRSR